jgi:D-alanyl-D-alanine carboxypeptidase
MGKGTAGWRSVVVGLAVATLVTVVWSASPAQANSSDRADKPSSALDRAIRQLVARPDGPPGVIVVVDRSGHQVVHSAGTSTVGASTPIQPTDHLRMASVAKAYSGAVALSLVSQGVLSLRDTVGKWLPTLPAAWSRVTLAELLQHTSNIPDFSQTQGFQDAVMASPFVPPAHEALLSFVTDPKLPFPPGSRYHYSNSDNIIVALMIESATGKTYEQELSAQVFAPLGLSATSLPSDASLPAPFAHGYGIDPPEPPTDITSVFAAGWAWASGGIVSTPSDATAFVRAYARGANTNAATHTAQFRFRPGSSEPPGPGVNSAGLAIFRYQTRCGTVYGHTGNTAGYTQFVAATADGRRSVTVSINSQIVPKTNAEGFVALQKVYLEGVCAALED